MIESFTLYLSLLFAIVILIMIANRIKVAYPILLVGAGLVMSLVPGIPRIRIDPELIFILFLPPLLYEAAWAISIKELWHWRRIVVSFAFVVVFITASSVAVVSWLMIPGFTVALGFLLGGIVSPPDAVSANAIMKFVKMPNWLRAILQGESLLNDASSLIIFRFALIAAATGQFTWYLAVGNFFWMVLAGATIGIVIALLFMKIHTYLPTDANMDIILSLIAPYAMYILAEEFYASGVLATVCGGLLMSYHRNRFLTSSSRLRGFNVWESLIFVFNGCVFLMIGLELPEITAGLEGVSLAQAIRYGLLVCSVLIVGRIIISYGAVLVTMIMKRFIKVAEGRPGFRGPFVLGWSGMRGVVSLAAALSIPVRLADGTAFPQRNIILFITFVVILVTLLLQGLTLPMVIRKLHLKVEDPAETKAEQDRLNRGMFEHGLLHLKKNHPDALEESPLLQGLVDRWCNRDEVEEELHLPDNIREIYLEMLEQQRQWLIATNRREPELDEHLVRRHLYRLDVEEEKLRYS